MSLNPSDTTAIHGRETRAKLSMGQRDDIPSFMSVCHVATTACHNA